MSSLASSGIHMPSAPSKKTTPHANTYEDDHEGPVAQVPGTVHENREDEDDETPAAATPAELRFFMLQIYEIIKPVVLCIILTIVWVKISMLDYGFRPEPGMTVYQEQATDSDTDRLLGSLTNALIFIGCIVFATVIFVVLFKYGCVKALHGYLYLNVILVLGFMGLTVLTNIITVSNSPLDWISVMFGLWNFAATGVMVIFWRGPMWLQQLYLVVMSSLLAFVLSGFQEWTTWLLLGCLAIWDLIAVLCPYGPLKILIESSEEQNQDIPALLYSVTMVWFGVGMATVELEKEKVTSADESDTEAVSNSLHVRNPPTNNSQADLIVKPESEQSPPETKAVDTEQPQPKPSSRPSQRDQESDDDEGQPRSGLKLGLGDFIFYSVLISRTAMRDWVTTIACFIAVMSGLISTIFLLAMYRKALPALPISIAFGIVFYFLSSLLLKPFVDNLIFNGVFI